MAIKWNKKRQQQQNTQQKYLKSIQEKRKRQDQNHWQFCYCAAQRTIHKMKERKRERRFGRGKIYPVWERATPATNKTIHVNCKWNIWKTKKAERARFRSAGEIFFKWSLLLRMPVNEHMLLLDGSWLNLEKNSQTKYMYLRCGKCVSVWFGSSSMLSATKTTRLTVRVFCVRIAEHLHRHCFSGHRTKRPRFQFGNVYTYYTT